MKCRGHDQQVVVEELEEVGAVDRLPAGSASLSGSGTVRTEAISQPARGRRCAAVQCAGAAGGAVDG